MAMNYDDDHTKCPYCDCDDLIINDKTETFTCLCCDREFGNKELDKGERGYSYI